MSTPVYFWDMAEVKAEGRHLIHLSQCYLPRQGRWLARTGQYIVGKDKEIDKR
jgi:hypothetical protein